MEGRKPTGSRGCTSPAASAEKESGSKDRTDKAKQGADICLDTERKAPFLGVISSTSLSTLPLPPQTLWAAVILQLAIRLPQLGYSFNKCQSRFSNVCPEKCLKRQVQGENEGIEVISLSLPGGSLNTQSCFHNPMLLYHLYACEEGKKTRKSQIPLQRDAKHTVFATQQLAGVQALSLNICPLSWHLTPIYKARGPASLSLSSLSFPLS